MDWSVDLTSGHCAHGEGLTAFLDVGKEGSCYLRCLGPFGSEMLDPQRVLILMSSLTELLESAINGIGKRVVWGSYIDKADYLEHQFPIQGGFCGFLPNLVMRESLVGLDANAQGGRSWQEEEGALVHFSGLRLEKSGRSVDLSCVDPQLLHPDYLEDQARELVALCWMPGLDNELPAVRVDLGSLTWSRMRQRLLLVR